MFNRTQLLNTKREVILACINVYNEAKARLASNEDTGSQRRARALNQWKRYIKQFNMPSRHAYWLMNPISILILESPEVTLLYNSFRSEISYTDALNTLFYVAIGLTSYLAACLIPFIIPEIFVLTIWFPAMMASIVGWAIWMGVYYDPEYSVEIEQVFDVEELEDYFQGSEFDKLISHLSPHTPVFINKYPAPIVRKILADIPESITTLDLDRAQFDKLSPDYLIQLVDALPHITTLEVSESVINNMSFEQLDAFAKIIPNVDKVKDHRNTVPSEKIQYLQSKIESNQREKAMVIIHTLSQLEKGRPSKTGVQTARYCPMDMVNYMAEFFPRSAEIRNGIKSLADMAYVENNKTTPTNS